MESETKNRSTRVAILDLGTNTFHLLIADIGTTDRPVIIFQETIAVKLGEGGITKGTISPEAFKRGLDALKSFKQQISQFQAGEVKSAATSAIRSASNGAEFIERIKTETGLDIDIVDGEREAELIYKGVRAAIDMEFTSLIVDIGGGSVEFIICNRHEIFWKKSYPIGAARLMAKFHKNDPILDSEINKLNDYLDDTLTDLQNHLDDHKPQLMIGSAGSFETFAQFQDPNFKPGFEIPQLEIDLEQYKATSDQIIKSNHKERREMPAITDVRVDMIVVSTILTNYIIRKSGIKSLKLSTYSLKEGVLFGFGK